MPSSAHSMQYQRRKTYIITLNFYEVAKNFQYFLYDLGGFILQRMKKYYFTKGEIHMKSIKKFFQTNAVTFQTLSCLALTVATFAANSRCAYIYHDPKKPSELDQLKKF